MTTAQDALKRAAADIARAIRLVRLGDDVDAVERDFVEAIVGLVNDATNGHPKPVLPRSAASNLEPWEGKVWGIVRLGDYALRPLSMHLSEEGARLDLARRQKLPVEDDHHLPEMDIGVLSGEAAVLFWNSYEPDPRIAPPVAGQHPVEICEYCSEPANTSKPEDTDGGIGPLKSYDAGNGPISLFHEDCHADMMRDEICGGAETCDVEDPEGDHCSCFAEGLSCCGCKAVPLP